MAFCGLLIDIVLSTTLNLTALQFGYIHLIMRETAINT